jgi:hypothetical protein
MTELIAAEVRGLMLKILRRHWRGGYGLWVSLLCCSLLAFAVVFFTGVHILGSISPDIPPYRRMFLGTPIFLVIGAVGIWQLIGTWRASSAARATTNYRISRWFARLTAIAVALVAFATLAALPALLKNLYEMATDQDQFGLAGNSVEVSDTNLIVSGYFSWGLIDRVEAALDANPGVDTVVLNSPGGHSGVGRKLSTLFAARHLDTAVIDLCASACTFAYSGGQRRFAGPKARLGFHAEAADNPKTLKNSQEITRAYWLQFGLPEEFIEKVNNTPASDVWFPSLKELRNLNFITE